MLIANLERWNPVDEINQIQEGMNRIFTNHAEKRHSAFFPKYDVWEIDNKIILTSELPGLEKDDIEITVEEDLLTLKGNKKAPVMNDRELLLLKEHLYGEFTRTIKLPYRVNPDQVEAKFRSGVLTIRLNRPEEDKAKRIEIQAE